MHVELVQELSDELASAAATIEDAANTLSAEAPWISADLLVIARLVKEVRGELAAHGELTSA